MQTKLVRRRPGPPMVMRHLKYSDEYQSLREPPSASPPSPWYRQNRPDQISTRILRVPAQESERKLRKRKIQQQLRRSREDRSTALALPTTTHSHAERALRLPLPCSASLRRRCQRQLPTEPVADALRGRWQAKAPIRMRRWRWPCYSTSRPQ